MPLNDLIDMLHARRARTGCAGTAVFLTSDPDVAPVALMHNLKHNKVLHEKNVILTVAHRRDARACADADRITIEPINDDFKQGDASPTASWRARTCPRPWRCAASRG